MGWGKAKGKGFFGPGPRPFGPRPFGPVVAAEAAVVGAVAGAAVVASARPHPKPKPRPARPVEVVVVQGSVPVAVTVHARPKGRGKGKGKGKRNGQMFVPAINISMPPSISDIRGNTYYFAIDVTSQGGERWRVMRSYEDFHNLYNRLQCERLAPLNNFPQSLDKMASQDRRHDFGLGLPRCCQCGHHCKNRGDKESGAVYCSDCYNKRFPEPHVLQAQHGGLEWWLQQVVKHPNSQRTWTDFLRAFLEVGRQNIVTTPTATAAQPPEVPLAASHVAPSAPVEDKMTALTAAEDEPHGHDVELLSVTIPKGVASGQSISIAVPGGRQLQFTVPEGTSEGDSLDLCFESATGTLTLAQLPSEHSDVESPEMLSIQIPEGVSGGQALAINVPDGSQIAFLIPEGKISGEQLDLWYDPRSGTLTPA